MEIAMLGIDLGKNSCSVVGLDSNGKVSVRRRMRRETVIAFCSKLSPCVVAMEACCGAHHMGRALASQGHVVRLMSPEYVRPYVKLWSGEHIFTNRQVTIMRRNVRRRPDCWRFRSHSSALFQSVSSQASTLASRFQDGWPPGVVGTATFSRAFRFVSRLALA